MNKLITVSVTFVVQDRTDEDDANRQQYRNPEMPFELMDSDNFRESFYNTVEDAAEAAGRVVEDALGLSGGVGLGAVVVTTEE